MQGNAAREAARTTFSSALTHLLAQRSAERQRASLPGYLCEQCLDAPADVLVPAPCGGDMGVCAACADTRQAEG